MNKALMLEQLINHYTGGNKAHFAAMIGIKPQVLSNWIKRNTFDAEQVYKYCKEVSADWLLSGKGKMTCNSQNDNPKTGDTEILDLCNENIRLISIIDRLQKYMEVKGINDNQMTVAAGLSMGLLGKMKKNGKGMNSANIEKILLTYRDLSPEWLIIGEGEMFKPIAEKSDMNNSAELPDEHKIIIQQNSEIIKQNSEIIRQNAILFEMVAKIIGGNR